jgi:hypothetical protein
MLRINASKPLRKWVPAIVLTTGIVLNYWSTTGTSQTIGSIGTNDFVGIWDNGRGEFQTMRLGLRSDGRGFFSGAMAFGPIRWKLTTNGCEVTTLLATGTLPLKFTISTNPPLRFSLTTDKASLLLQRAGEADLLKKTSATEPVDVENRMLLAYEDGQRLEAVAETAQTNRVSSVNELQRLLRGIILEGKQFGFVRVEGHESGAELHLVKLGLAIQFDMGFQFEPKASSQETAKFEPTGSSLTDGWAKLMAAADLDLAEVERFVNERVPLLQVDRGLVSPTTVEASVKSNFVSVKIHGEMPVSNDLVYHFVSRVVTNFPAAFQGQFTVEFVNMPDQR